MSIGASTFILFSDSDESLQYLVPDVSYMLDTLNSPSKRRSKQKEKEMDFETEEDFRIYNPDSLVDIVAKYAGMHCTCQELESHDPPLDDILLKKVLLG